MLSHLIEGERPMEKGKQLLVESVILREPTREEVEACLPKHRSFEDFDLQ